MTALPDGYTLRHLSSDELPAAQLVLDAAESADGGEPRRHEMDIAVMAATTMLDLERSVWVVVAPDGSFAGCGLLWQPLEGDTEFVADHYVHPAHREGVADDALIDAIERRVADLHGEMPSMNRLVLFCENSNARRSTSLRQRGYEHVRDFHSMRIDLASGRPHARWPAGIEVRPIRPGVDDRAAHAASEDAFAEHYLFGPTPFDDWRTCTLDRDDCDPLLWLLAWDGDQVSGQVWAVARDEGAAADVGMVEDLSVRKPWRGRGLGLTLLDEVFRLLGDRGCASARLFVDVQNATGALRLYERAGMRVERRILGLERRLE
jgi:mycothiol synthase